MSRRHDADIHGRRSPFSHPLKLLPLQHTEQGGLHLDRKLTHLVEKERASVSPFESSRVGSHRARKCPGDMAEEFTRRQGWGQRTAIDGNQRAFLTRARLVNRPCDQLLSRPGFALNHYGNVQRGHATHRGEELAHRNRVSENRPE